MNSVNMIGRLTKDPELRYTQSQMAVARFTIAIDRGKDKDGNDRGTDFPSIVVFGKSAENCEKHLKKGLRVAVTGHIQTGSYEKDGRKIYTTDVIADRVLFIEWAKDDARKNESSTEEPMPEQLELMDGDDIPF